MYSPDIRALALELVDEGQSLNSVAKELGISRAAIREWRQRGVEASGRARCPLLNPGVTESPTYAALLGYYLGDGCVSTVGRSYSLRISCDAQYPGIIQDVTRLMTVIRPHGAVNQVAAPGCIVVCAYSNHWPCLFPQHGPGRKHERHLELEPWQRTVVDAYPGAFLRGLFHSDGCRVRNWATRQVAGQTKRYEYARWQFVNHSTDIQRFCTDALDLLGIPWRQSSWKHISVSRREAVARLDDIVGPKS